MQTIRRRSHGLILLTFPRLQDVQLIAQHSPVFSLAPEELQTARD